MFIRNGLAFVRATCLGLALSGWGMACAAANWPQERPIRFVLGLAAGGGTDVATRILTTRLSERLGQTIVIENVTGAGGTLASANVARSAPDGYTFEIKTISSAVINGLWYDNLSYDPVKDFSPVSLVGRAPMVAVVSNQVSARTLPELLTLLKQDPEKYTYGSSGLGTVPYLAGEMFNSLTGAKMLHVPYRGNGPALSALLAGDITLIFDLVGSIKPYVEDGSIHALGVTTAEPTPLYPDVPPIARTVPGFAIDTWFGIFAPAGTPKEILEKMASETGAVLRQPDIAAQINKVGYEAVPTTPAEFDAFWHQQLDKFTPLVKGLDLKRN